jgi:hypothetical protein
MHLVLLVSAVLGRPKDFTGNVVAITDATPSM